MSAKEEQYLRNQRSDQQGKEAHRFCEAKLGAGYTEDQARELLARLQPVLSLQVGRPKNKTTLLEQVTEFSATRFAQQAVRKQVALQRERGEYHEEKAADSEKHKRKVEQVREHDHKRSKQMTTVRAKLRNDADLAPEDEAIKRRIESNHHAVHQPQDRTEAEVRSEAMRIASANGKPDQVDWLVEQLIPFRQLAKAQWYEKLRSFKEADHQRREACEQQRDRTEDPKRHMGNIRAPTNLWASSRCSMCTTRMNSYSVCTARLVPFAGLARRSSWEA
jgi:hypothetical protein